MTETRRLVRHDAGPTCGRHPTFHELFRESAVAPYSPLMVLRFVLPAIAALLCAAFQVGCKGIGRPPQMTLPPEIDASDLVRWFDDAGVARSTVDWSEIDRLHDLHLRQLLPLRTAAARSLRDIAPTSFKLHHVDVPDLVPAQVRAAASVQTRLLSESRALEEEFLYALQAVKGVDRALPAMLVARRSVERIYRLSRATSTGRLFDGADAEDPVSQLANILRDASESGSARSSTSDLCAVFQEVASRSLPGAERWWQSVCGLGLAQALESERARLQAEREQQRQQQSDVAVDDAGNDQPAVVEAELPPLSVTAQEAADRALETFFEVNRTASRTIESLDGRLPKGVQTAAAELLMDKSVQIAHRNQLIAIRVGIEHPECSAAARAALLEIRERLRTAHHRGDSMAALRILHDRVLMSLRTAVSGAPEVDQAMQFALAHGRAPDPADAGEAQPEEMEEEYRLAMWRDMGGMPHRMDTNRICAVGSAAGLEAGTCLAIAASADVRYRALEQACGQRIEAAEAEANAFDSDVPDEERRRAAELAVRALFRHLQSIEVLVSDADKPLLDDIRVRCALQGLPSRPSTMLFEALRASNAPSEPSIRRRVGNDWFQMHVIFDTLSAGSVALLAIDDELPQSTRDLLTAMIDSHWDQLLPAIRDTSAARAQALRDIMKTFIVFRSDDNSEALAALVAAVRRYHSTEAVWENIEDRVVEDVCRSLPTEADARLLRAVRMMRRFPEMFESTSNPIALDFQCSRMLASRLPDAAFDALGPRLDHLDAEVVAAVRAAVDDLSLSAPNNATIAVLATERPELRSISMRRVNAAVRAARDAGLEIPLPLSP